MKILYGVQGTGNGHISRARAIQKELAKTNIQVDWLFSGRAKDNYFDMESFENADYRKGLTFHLENGGIKYLRTARNLDLRQFKNDVQSIDVDQYDLILTDFEPITAWAGKNSKLPVIGLGHQYVFDFPVPQKKGNIVSRNVLKNFAPVKDHLPLHWHHFHQNILPPIIEAHPHLPVRHESKSVVVYLPFENQQVVMECLAPIRRYNFTIFSPKPLSSKHSHIHFKPLSRDEFVRDLYSCDAVIANAGFELSSEVISLGKRLLIKPLGGQMEQHSNALALKKLLYGMVMYRLSSWEINRFLSLSVSVKVNYPNVAKYIVKWIESGIPERNKEWYEKIWQGVKVKRGYTITPNERLAYI